MARLAMKRRELLPFTASASLLVSTPGCSTEPSPKVGLPAASLSIEPEVSTTSAKRGRVSVTAPTHCGTFAGHDCGTPLMHEGTDAPLQFSGGRLSSTTPLKSLSKPSQYSPT